MKKIFLFPVLLMVLFSFSSCEKDDSLDPRPVIIGGQYVRLDITSKVLRSKNSNTSVAQFTDEEISQGYFGGLLTDPSGKITEYKLYVKKRDIFGATTEFKPLPPITTFPLDLRITLTDIATALEVPVSSLVWGDEYYFYGESFDAAGNRADFYSLSATVQGAQGMKNGYRFRTSTQIKDFYLQPANLDQYDNYVNP